MATTSLPVVFNFGNQSIRTIDQDGEVWFVASDVCDALELSNPTAAISRLDDDERSMFNIGQGNTLNSNEGIPGARGNPNTNIINESGLYSLVMGSRKAEAKAFKRWVTHDVLPAIRKTGRYEAPPHPEPTAKPFTHAEMLAEVLTYGRFFMTVDRGHIRLDPVPEDALFVADVEKLASLVQEPTIVPLHTLPRIIEVAANRLKEVYGRKK